MLRGHLLQAIMLEGIFSLLVQGDSSGNVTIGHDPQRLCTAKGLACWIEVYSTSFCSSFNEGLISSGRRMA